MILFFVFKFSECKQESDFTFSMSPGAGAGVIFGGTGAGVKKSDSDHSMMTMLTLVRKHVSVNSILTDINNHQYRKFDCSLSL